MPVQIFKKDVDGLGWGPFAVGAAFVDPGDGTVTLYATQPCPTCRKP